MDFKALKTAGTMIGVGTGIGGAIGIVDQMVDVERGIEDGSLQTYKNSVMRHMRYGAIAGLGLYGFSHTSNKALYTSMLGIGAGIGTISGIQNQIGASKIYNDAHTDANSLFQSGIRIGAAGMLNGAGAYGGYEVARRIAKGAF